ncbi:MAG: hypothetical protein P9M06_01880 [Candidatus Saelkia tenebricola]|nr:hypothetical protein [Candidatus Saelkia tenebricola]
MLQLFFCATKNNKKQATVLVFVVGMLVVVLILSMAMIMLASSQYFLTHAQKEDLTGFYIAEAQIQWAALKLKENLDYDPNSPDAYTGGDSSDDIYTPGEIDMGSINNIKIVVELEGGIFIDEYDNAVWDIKSYVKFKKALGKRETAVRVDAQLVKDVDIDAEGTTITYTIENWQEVRPPIEPE